MQSPVTIPVKTIQGSRRQRLSYRRHKIQLQIVTQGQSPCECQLWILVTVHDTYAVDAGHGEDGEERPGGVYPHGHVDGDLQHRDRHRDHCKASQQELATYTQCNRLNSRPLSSRSRAQRVLGTQKHQKNLFACSSRFAPRASTILKTFGMIFRVKGLPRGSDLASRCTKQRLRFWRQHQENLACFTLFWLFGRDLN